MASFTSLWQALERKRRAPIPGRRLAAGSAEAGSPRRRAEAGPRFQFALVILAALWLVTTPLPASDLAKEQRWAEQIVDALLDGEAVWLEADTQRFLGIHTEASGEEGARGVVILHGIGVHPDWPGVIAPLRVGLAERGWETLSLQMPVLPNEADPGDYAPLFDEAIPRIRTGIEHLRSRGVQKVVLAGHSLGAAMGSYYLSRSAETAGVHAFVGIGMSGLVADPRMDNVVSLAKIRLPVLDLYGSQDLPAVLRSASQRADAAKSAGNAAYTQDRVEGVDHFFTDADEELVDRVAQWLGQLR